MIKTWKGRVKRIKMEVYTLYLAYKDPRVPLYAKVFAACVAGYALSPIDLIPDFIPVLGYLDDLVLVPLGIMLALRMIPDAVLTECREKARGTLNRERPRSRVAAVVVVSIWVLTLALITTWVVRAIK